MMPPAFLALELLSEPCDSEWCIFTPRLMQWGERVWLMDLTVTRSYWQIRAAGRATDVLSLMREILDTLFGKEHPIYRAAFAPLPWQAALLVTYMAERDLRGMVNFEHKIGHALFQQLSWSAWITAAEQIIQHLVATKVRRFNPDSHRCNLKLLKASAARLHLERPWQLKEATDLAIKRRFGATQALLWEWAYGSDDRLSALPKVTTTSFPWISWVPPCPPMITRHLDFSVWQWEIVAPFLVEDFDRLCRLTEWNVQERITRLRWKITLNDLSSIDVPILFRHPHSLHKEIGHHKTAVLQANYAFADIVAQVKERLPRDDLEIVTPIIGWTLIIEERLTVPPMIRSLFGDIDAANSIEQNALLEIENQLPIELELYDLRGDWLPEDSFRQTAARETFWIAGTTSEPWRRLARLRPLFVYESLALLDTIERSTGRIFLERMTTKWWQAANGRTNYRDYYRLTDHQRRNLWVLQDSSGHWYVHGLFA